MFHSQQETLQENQQHQYQIYQDLMKLVIKSPPSNYSQTSENNTLEIPLSTEQNQEIPIFRQPTKSNLNKTPSNGNLNNNKSVGFLDELKTVLKSRDNPI